MIIVPVPAAGVVKVLVQVYTQVEANGSEMKVGLGRDEPNRLPSLTYPKTGRSWQAVLPTALAVVEAVMDAYQGGTKRCKFLMMIVFLVIVILGLHSVKGGNDCPIIQASCNEQCDCCAVCAVVPKEPDWHCYYKWQSADGFGCAEKSKCLCMGTVCDYKPSKRGECLCEGKPSTCLV